MEIRKLSTKEEKLTADETIAAAFLHDFDREEARKERAEEKETGEEIFAAFGETGEMAAAVSTLRRQMFFGGKRVSCGDVHMVGTLPEYRGQGRVRRLMKAVLEDLRARGDLFAVLIPFSFAFYRRYGFEAASANVEIRAAVGQFSGFPCTLAPERLLSADPVPEMRGLYESFMGQFSLAQIRPDTAWEYRGEGEVGERDWMHREKRPYTYLFRDGEKRLRGYFTFIFVHGAEGPFVGDMKVTDIVFDGPEALRSIFGFIHRFRAKIENVCLTLPRGMDVSLLLPETDEAERKLDCHVMARVLDVEGVLRAMRYPREQGAFTLFVEDRFLEENTGFYRVRYNGGAALSVEKDASGEADAYMTEGTFCQLAAGLIGPDAAAYREGTRICGGRDVLSRVFVPRPVFLT